MPPFPFKKLIERLKEFYSDDVPVVTRLAARRHDPFLVLIGCLLSLRTKDETTDKAMERLTKIARTPKAILAMPVAEIEKAIYPVGFYRVKARLLRERVADRHREIRQPRARYARRAADYQGRWAENGQHRYHGGLRHPRRSSRHARTPHLEQAGHRQDQVAGRDRDGAAPASSAAILDIIQPAHRHPRAQDMRAHLSFLQQMPGVGYMRPGWRNAVQVRRAH